ncbi:unnamed protein product [Cyprideis torosa]|uniref:Uncharacterized protein n=1 Tax=Cyprideis torosa TaxID=163714 RepID=A0A7R8WCY7_9CRUS|nr:unnamed protein product [Cyprideis torosa]CAG0888417.1 unnamed protein product [Cyprideis torosa]
MGFDNPQKMGFDNPQKMGFDNPQKMGFDNPQKMGFDNPQKMGLITLRRREHTDNETFWSTASIDDWAREMAGARIIAEKFANITDNSIVGLRSPYLRVGGNNQFTMMEEQAFLYDSTITAPLSNPPLWPYTLYFRMPHTCYGNIQNCPTRCAMVDSCSNLLNGDQFYNFLNYNFDRHYLTNRAPFGLYFHAAWLKNNPEFFDAFLYWLDEILQLEDVYFVTMTQAIQWIQNPRTTSEINNFEPWKDKCTPDVRTSFTMMEEQAFLYDSTITAPLSNPPLWPYTLYFRMPHTCYGNIQNCPTRSHAVWEMVMNELDMREDPTFDEALPGCAMVDSCSNLLNGDQFYNFLNYNFDRHYLTNRAPFGLYFHAAWLKNNPEFFDAFLYWLDEILQLEDVYFVTMTQAIQWIQNPRTTSEINNFEPWKDKCTPDVRTSVCGTPNSCATTTKELPGETLRLHTCVKCPNKFPWILDPLGEGRV